MKTPLDFTDRIQQLLTVSGFAAMLKNGISTEPSVTVTTETGLITTTGAFTGHDVVDTADVAISLIIKDVNGASDNQRFRYLSGQLIDVLQNKELYKDDFLQYKRNNTGAKQTTTIDPDNEWFNIRIVNITGAIHDPERPGYSYLSVRVNCWIEK